VKRVVTSDRDGQSYSFDITEVSDIEVVKAGAMDIWALWGVDQTPRLPFDGRHTEAGFYPAPGAVRVTLIRFGPDGTPKAPLDGTNEVTELLAEGGRHTTPTMDIGWIISGELGLELDSGDVVWFQAGDVVIQNGTSHTWHNRSGVDALTGWVVLGAEVTDPARPGGPSST
jgi:hypothetical protein